MLFCYRIDSTTEGSLPQFPRNADAGESYSVQTSSPSYMDVRTHLNDPTHSPSRRLFPLGHIFIAHLLPKQLFYPSRKQSTEKGNTVRMQGSIDVKVGPIDRISQIVWNLALMR
ncbi:hypothetical protein TNIN_332031 [Trichonephila inaurata madagascariensis]|uniref:Uncharacterized protein n=1 Tax=Trichonephila inaurata madagascariensis TaxID=2747483 RepID=A0A8X6I7F6_9ARAC|nr:hypothetical protein TNIN_332031 [Trichonephila inaurata madagascariensis]